MTFWQPPAAARRWSFILACILDEGDELLVPEPYYANYNTFAYMTGGKIHPIPTSAENGYHYAERSLIEPHINAHTRGILISNPGNPTGVVLTREEMRLIADIVKEHDLFLVADEVYREFIYDDEPMGSFGELEDVKDRVILVDSVSKRFSACGARVGSIICRNKEFMAEALKLCQGRLCSATIDQVGAAAMYRSVTPDYFKAVRDEYKKRRDTVVEELGKLPGVKFDVPDGAFYMMVTLPVDDVEKLQYFLLEEFEDNGETVMYAPGQRLLCRPGRWAAVRFALPMSITASICAGPLNCWAGASRPTTGKGACKNAAAYRNVEVPSGDRGGAGPVSHGASGPLWRDSGAEELPGPPGHGGQRL